MSPYFKKRLMAAAGLFWFSYLVIHMLANLNFLTGEDNFDGFYHWFHEAVILRWSVIGLLGLSIGFHIYTALSRQFDSNNKRQIAYKKPYPQAVSRFVAWSGASMLFAFIVFHFVQMQLLPTHNFYQEVSNIFSMPLMIGIYALGFFSLSTHLHHALSSVLQTFGLTHKQHHGFVFLIIFILMGGFISVPISVYL